MPKGGCFCEAIAFQYEGDIQGKVSAQSPQGHHPTMNADGYLYRRSAIAGKTSTNVLLASHQPLTRLPSDCQKITGSTYSTNIIVPGDKFEVTKGTPKTISKTADSGNKITSHFCGDCGSTLWRDGDSFGPSKVIKVGTLDDPKAFDDAKPAIELYAPERISWVGSQKEAGQLKGMPGSEEV